MSHTILRLPAVKTSTGLSRSTIYLRIAQGTFPKPVGLGGRGKPVIRGLRYPVESMLDYLAAGDSIDDLLTEFPDLEREDLLACLQFAATAIKLKTLHVRTAT